MSLDILSGPPIAIPSIEEDPLDLMDQIDALKREKNATILAHYYVDGEIQDIADHTGDSLALSRIAAGSAASTIVFCGVHFMAETAKILSPHKTVLIPDARAADAGEHPGAPAGGAGARA